MDQQTGGAQAAQEVVDVTQRQVLEKAGAKFKRIAKEISLIAFSDLGDYVDVAEGGEIQAIPFSKISPNKRRVLKKIKEHTQIKESADGQSIFKDSRIEFELYDKLDALKYLCTLRNDVPKGDNPAAIGELNIHIHQPGKPEDGVKVKID